MLAQAGEYVPGSGVLASGFAAEQKFDGHRAILFTPTGPGGRLLLQTRRGESSGYSAAPRQPHEQLPRKTAARGRPWRPSYACHSVEDGMLGPLPPSK
ncbi:hypothetical protein [Streptomyces virginiae]|uniref:hypothetical protein n=1 Tax=Streptomyces virginiae TaxID=1961 RepID=UPI003431C383